MQLLLNNQAIVATTLEHGAELTVCSGRANVPAFPEPTAWPTLHYEFYRIHSSLIGWRVKHAFVRMVPGAFGCSWALNKPTRIATVHHYWRTDRTLVWIALPTVRPIVRASFDGRPLIHSLFTIT